jgi:uncharacterized OsmC-like protein
MSGAEDAAAGPVVVESGPGGGLVARTAAVTMDVGRGEGRPTSVELLLAGLGSCMLGTMLAFAHNSGIPVEGVRLELEPVIAPLPERVARIAMRMTIEGPVTERQLASLRRVAEHCKVHNTLERSPELELSIAAAQSVAPGEGEDGR